MVRVVPVEEVRPLRHKILRPGQPYSTTAYPEDDALPAFHFAAYGEGVVVGIVSLYLQDHDTLLSSGKAWRLRGMATDTHVRGRGYGKALVEASITFVVERGGTALWCNARATAEGFYEGLGFRTSGEPFEIAGIGKHFFMFRDLLPNARDAR